MKTCSQCKIKKPFEAFWRQKDSNDGLQSFCIECIKLRRLELKNNPLMQLERQIKSSVILENKLLKRENKRLCNKCKEIFLIDYLLGGVICKECNEKKSKYYWEKNKEKMREYKEKNKEKIKKQMREYYKENKEKMIEQMSKYKKKNKEKIKEYQKEYYEKNKLERLKNEDL